MSNELTSNNGARENEFGFFDGGNDDKHNGGSFVDSSIILVTKDELRFFEIGLFDSIDQNKSDKIIT